MNFSPSRTVRAVGAYTLIELLIVLAILATLAGLMFPAFTKIKEKAEMAKAVHNVNQITNATLRWAADRGDILPSPEYPGGHGSNFEPPEQWDFTGAGTGLWLDGVVYYAVYFEQEDNRREERGDAAVEGGGGDSDGSHLKGTFFESLQSVKKNRDEEDWHKHSYAMNKELQYDYIYRNSSDPYLTEKSLGKLVHRPSALLYIENKEENVIGFDDRDDIIETAKERWTSGKTISSYLDGHVSVIAPYEIPEDDPYTDRESSKFWRGVDVDSYSGK